MRKLLFALIFVSSCSIYATEAISKEVSLSLFLRKIISAYEDGMSAVEKYKGNQKIKSKYYIDDDLRACTITPKNAVESFLADFSSSYVYYAYYGDSQNKAELAPKFQKLKSEFVKFMDKLSDFSVRDNNSEYTIEYKSDYCEVTLEMYENSNLPDGTWCITLNIDAF